MTAHISLETYLDGTKKYMIRFYEGEVFGSDSKRLAVDSVLVTSDVLDALNDSAMLERLEEKARLRGMR